MAQQLPSTSQTPTLMTFTQISTTNNLITSGLPVQTQHSSQMTLSQALAQPPQNVSVPQPQVQIAKNPIVILDKTRLQELVQEIDPNEQLDEDVEEMLLSIADDFIESLVSSSALIAKHRKSSTLDVKDVQIALEKNWNMWVPGFGTDDLKPPKKLASTEAHKQRMALIRKAIKKF